MHDIGEMPIYHYVVDYPELMQSEELLDEVIHVLRGVLGDKILQKWSFSPELLDVPGMAEAWGRESPGPVDYTDLVIVAQVHDSFGKLANPDIPPLVELPAFNKMTLSRLGPDASVELLHGAQEEVRKMLRILLN